MGDASRVLTNLGYFDRIDAFALGALQGDAMA